MFTFPGFISRSRFVLIQASVFIVLFVFMLYLYYLLFCSFNVSTLNLYKIYYQSFYLESVLRHHQLITYLSHFCCNIHLKINDKIYVYYYIRTVSTFT
jgi:hypothetical protein